MQMTGEERINASREAVYAALNDPEILKQCIPGCKEIIKKSDIEMEAKAGISIGPVKANFSGAITLSDLNPPEGYTITGEGKGGPAGFAKGGASVSLAEDGAATILSYEVKADVGGKLAQLGSRLIDSTAKKMAKEFFSKFGEIVGEPEVEEAISPAADAVAESATPIQQSNVSAEETGGSNKLVIGAIIVGAVLVLGYFALG